MAEKSKKNIIGIDGHMIGDRSGGNETYYKNVLKRIPNEPDRHIYLFLKPDIDVGPFEKQYTIIRFKSRNAAIRNFVELPVLARRLRLDLLHTQYFIPLICPCPVVCTIHDICFEHYKDIFTLPEYLRQKVLIPYAAKKSKAVFTVSEFSKQDIATRYGVSPERIIVTYNAVDENFRKLDETTLDDIGLRKQFGIGDAPFVLTVGNLQPRKNLPRLIKAFQNMVSQCVELRDYRLVIVGKKAWKFTDILNMAEEENIILTDYVTESELVRLYNSAELFVYPSFFEGFGLPPLEAMACGTPVAVADTSALPEVVGDAGVFFNPFDTESIKMAMVKILADKGLQRALITRGFRQIKKFSWDRSAQLISEQYGKVLMDKGHKR